MKRALVAAVVLLAAVSAFAQELRNGAFVKLPGMNQAGMVTREDNGIPHILAFTRHDMHFLTGWLHANDRLFQMDVNRRIASGTLGELLGQPAIGNDVQLRTFGLRRAAEASLPVMSAEARAALDSYSAGVNAWLTAHPLSLPPEYSLVEVSRVAPWTPVDSIAVAKLIAFGLSFDLDIDPTVALLSYQAAGRAVGFDAARFFFNDTWRIAPFTPAATIPDATGAGRALPLREPSTFRVDTSFLNHGLIAAYAERVRDLPALQSALHPEKHGGSNEWAVAPRHSTTGNALIANDPHLALGTPATFYPISMRSQTVNASGMGFPGTPGVIQGQNARIAWGSTVHPMDVTDIYQEQLVPSATSPSGFVSLYKGAPETVQIIPQTYRINVIGNGVRDDLATVPPSSLVPPAVLIVPRHGPIIQVDGATGQALSIQYVGFYPTRELDAFLHINEAENIDEFKAALQFFDVGSQNFAYSDVEGNIAYFTSGELPLREDLQANTVTGTPPFFIRNGQGGNEWIANPGQPIPFRTLPFEEMPQVVNPSNGWFINANNDPTGNTNDNDPLNELRPGGGLKYLNAGYDGLRGGRLTFLMRQKLANGGKVSPEDMKAMQADVGLIDAQVFVPYITKALENARAAGANPVLAALGSNAAVAAAVTRLGAWNFTTPTGIDTGYDASDVNGALSAPSSAEIDASVAATIYAAWRSRFMANTVDGVVRAIFPTAPPLPPHQQALSAMRWHLDNYAANGGRGASGVNFFNVPDVSDANARRDIILLKSVADGLAMLMSDEFAPAFARSTDLRDYRWGKLHRLVLSHQMTDLFSIGAPFGQPPFPSVPGLRGLSVDGGYGTPDAASHNPRASTLNGFMFSSGPNRRYVGDMAAAAIQGQSSLPGGVSGIPGTPWSTVLLMPWLTNDTFPVIVQPLPRVWWTRR